MIHWPSSRPHIHIHTRNQSTQLLTRKQRTRRELVDQVIHTYTHTHTHTNEKTSDSPMSPEPEEIPRPARYIQGKEAEERLAEILSLFGRVQMGEGTNGEPDLLLETKRARYAVEAKTMAPMKRSQKAGVNGYQSNDLTLALAAWRDLSDYAAAHELERLLAVELRIMGARKGHLYHIVKGEAVDQLIKPGSNWISCNQYDLAALSCVSLRPGLPMAGGAEL